MKRSAPDTGETPAAKHARGSDDGVTPLTRGGRPHGRVSLDVGGTRFVSSYSTLAGSSSSFEALLARWDENADEPIFIDADSDAVKVLLSYMRLGALTLPEHDKELCARVLLTAEYLGMDALLASVKAKAYANMHVGDETDDERPAELAFDEEVGSLQDAINSKVLPARFFAPAPPEPPKPPEKPARTVKSIIPAPPGCAPQQNRTCVPACSP